MRVVVDTNIIFSLLLQKKSKFRKRFFQKDVEIFAPNFLMIEIIRHKEKLLKNSKLEEAEVIELLHLILQKIHFINEMTISMPNKIQAYEWCKDIDETDTPFVALALDLESSFWTGDKKLRAALEQRGFHKFFKVV